ncbi:MAG: hypothetical protein L3J52_03685, partial [Proteobacteria bacterium]|nr:hypothetical protein [Pseudomonadota bacterium]
SFEIYGQLLDSQANQIGENDFRISEMGPPNNPDYNAYSPSVAYNSVENEFMVVWYGEDDRDGRIPGEFEIYAQIVNAQTGGLIGVDSIAVSFVGLNGDVARSAQYPDVSYNQDANEYLLVWSADDSKDGRVGNEFEIYGQTLDAAGNEKLNNDFIISEMGVDGDNNFDAFRPKVVYQASTEQFVVLWRADDNVDGEFEIFTQRLDGQTLVRLGLTSQQISQAGPDNSLLYDARRADVAVSPHSNKLILVWEQEDETESQIEGEFEIFGSSLLNTDFVIDSSISGSWYDLSRSGEGYIVQILPNDRVLMVWFSYLPDTTEQAWFLGTGFVKHNRIVIDNAIITQGGIFGSNFDPAQVQNSPWGSVSFEFNTCRAGVVSYQANSQAYGHGDHSLNRLTTINGLACGEVVVQDEDPLNAITGSWYDPSHSGEGWLLEYLGNNRVVMYWFTYDDQGQQKWMLSVGEVSGQMVMTFDNAIMTNGTSFGDGFDPDRVNQFPWGSIEMTVNDCNSITVAYESSIALYGQGQLDARRLTSLDGIDCSL